MITGKYHPILGGAEIQAQRLSRTLKEKGIKIQIVTFRSPGLPSSDYVDGIPVRRLNAPYLKIRGQGIFVFYSSLVSLFYYLMRHRREYDLLHVHLFYGHSFAAALAGRLANVPVLVKVGNTGYRLDP